MNARIFTFAGGETGSWNIVKIRTIVGDPLVNAAKLDIINNPLTSLPNLRGTTSSERYVTRPEKEQLLAK